MTLLPASMLREPTITVLARPHFTEPSHLPVEWIGDATDGDRLMAFTGRLCSMSQRNPAGRSTREYLETLKGPEHFGVLDHATYSLLFEGVSRALAHTLVRESVGFSFSERSPRFVHDEDVCFVMPPAILGDDALERAWTAQIGAAHECYVALVNTLMTRYGWVTDKTQRRKMAREAAYQVLPSGTATQMVVTGSVRAWRTMILHCGSEHADLEMRRVALGALRLMRAEAPAVFRDIEIYQASDRRDAARIGYASV